MESRCLTYEELVYPYFRAHPSDDEYGALVPPLRILCDPGRLDLSIVFTHPPDILAKIFAGQFDELAETDHVAYTRLTDPPILTQLARSIAFLETGTEDHRLTLLTDCGMSAIRILLHTYLKTGSVLIASSRVYGGTHALLTQTLPKHGVQVVFVNDPTNLAEWLTAIKKHPQAKMLFWEDHCNPRPLKLPNTALVDIAHTYGMMAAIDNTIGTPLLDNIAQNGADFSIHSLTKDICGYANAMGGAIVARTPELITSLRTTRTIEGGILGTDHAYRILMGSLNLNERIAKKAYNLKQIVAFLNNHPAVEKIFHTQAPLLSFTIQSDSYLANRIIQTPGPILLATHLGHVRSMWTHPASTTHACMSPEDRANVGITETLIRLSVGCEEPEDILEHLDRALTHASS